MHTCAWTCPVRICALQPELAMCAHTLVSPVRICALQPELASTCACLLSSALLPGSCSKMLLPVRQRLPCGFVQAMPGALLCSGALMYQCCACRASPLRV